MKTQISLRKSRTWSELGKQNILAKNEYSSLFPLYSIYTWWDIHVGLILYRGWGNISFVLFWFGILSLNCYTSQGNRLTATLNANVMHSWFLRSLFLHYYQTGLDLKSLPRHPLKKSLTHRHSLGSQQLKVLPQPDGIKFNT